jgi:membrane associated rhomboid family serine protease
MIPLTVDVPMKRLPWANWGLILTTGLISLAVPFGTEELSGDSSREVIRYHYSRLVLQREGFAAYQLLTALLQHADPIHLFGNMLFLFVFGNAVNAKLGHGGFLASYFGIGVVVNLAWLVTGAGTACVGASGAIMGLCGMFLVLYPRNGVSVFWWDEVDIGLLARSWSGEISGWVIVLLYLAFDVWGALFDRKTNIAYVSHIVGGLLGIALAIVLLQGGWLAPDRGEQTLLQWLSGQGPVEEEVPSRPRRRKKRLPS